jgi:hypothetical protein
MKMRGIKSNSYMISPVKDMGVFVRLLANGTKRNHREDNVCAAAGSHNDMMRKEGFKTPKDCAQGCVKAGGQFVLFGVNKITYQLDDQEKPVDYAGQKVTVIGTYDGAAKTIHVQSIQSVP